jgi:hypothetical protein
LLTPPGRSVKERSPFSGARSLDFLFAGQTERYLQRIPSNDPVFGSSSYQDFSIFLDFTRLRETFFIFSVL